MLVDVIQYMLPDGRKRYHTIEVSDKCKPFYTALTKSKCFLTAEVLRTGEVSQTVTHFEGDFDIILTKGSGLVENKQALETLIKRFDQTKFDTWLKLQLD